jgi:hypothetical protein
VHLSQWITRARRAWLSFLLLRILIALSQPPGSNQPEIGFFTDDEKEETRSKRLSLDHVKNKDLT